MYPNYEKPQLDQEEFDNVVRLHNMWLKREKGGIRADFSYQNLAHLDFSERDLSGACFWSTNLNSINAFRTNFSGAHLMGAELEQANLAYANLSHANLTGASLKHTNLFRVKMMGTMGNGKEIKTIQIGGFPCAYTNKTIQFACQRHDIDVWVNITEAALEGMDPNAKTYYAHYYDLIKELVTETAPAAPSNYIDPNQEQDT